MEIREDTEQILQKPLVVTWQSLVVAAIFLFVIFTHFYGLDEKPYHHDESIHANSAYNLFQGKGYSYDPVYHGPFLYYTTALMFYLFGDNDTTARLGAALCGLGLIVLVLLLIRRQHWIHGHGMWILILLMISPTLTYFSRFLRMDIFSCFFAVLLLYSSIRYLYDKNETFFPIMAAALAGLYVTKENSHITAFIFCSFPFVFSAWFMSKPAVNAKESKIFSRSRFNELKEKHLLPHHIAVKGILIFGFSELNVFLYVILKQSVYFHDLTSNYKNTVSFGFLLVYVILVMLLYWGLDIFTRPKPEKRGSSPFSSTALKRNEPLIIGLMVLVIIFSLFYTNFLSKPQKVTDGLFKGLEYWMGQQESPRIPGPFLYYIPLLLIYELPILLFALWGVLRGLVFWKQITPWIILTGGALLSSETVSGKMQFSIQRMTGASVWELTISLIFILLGIWGINKFLSQKKAIDAFLVFWSVTAFFIYAFANEKVPWLATHLVLPLTLFAGSTLVDYFQSRKVTLLRPVGIVLIFLALSYSVHNLFLMTFEHESDPREIMVYVQSHNDVKLAEQKIRDIIFECGYRDEAKIICDDDNTWPFAWYLRDLNVTYLPSVNRLGARIILAKATPSAVLKKELEEENYIGARYRLRAWWTPDWKHLFSRPWQEIFRISRNYVLYRKIFKNEIGSTDFSLYYKPPWVDQIKVRDNDSLEKQPEVHSLSTDENTEIEPYGFSNESILKEQKGKTLLEIGTEKNILFNLKNPKDVEIGPEGKIYVADSGNHRIQIYNAQGKWLKSIGGNKGNANGEFNDPQGIAISAEGDIFVADTWNHRIQKFTPDGQWVVSFGESLQMWGPRDIEIGPNGNVFVSDTGRTMIRVFSKDGKHIREWGFKGTKSGQLSEPVGLAFDNQGLLVIADCGNRRIQYFSDDGDFIKEFSVDAWENFYSEPYIDIDSQNRIYLSDSDQDTILIYSGSGRLLTNLGISNEGIAYFKKPKGLAVDDEQDIYISDSENNRVVKVEIPFQTQ